MGAGDVYPSLTWEVPWIYAYPPTEGKINESALGGKWLIFISIWELDELWKTIADATEAGLLGPLSKAATERPSPYASDPETKVICVYTDDADDEADVMRVREMLREMGVTQRIPYKDDASTRAGRYAVRGDSGIARYYA